jgi:DNA-binding response OmpR family regulator
MPKVFVLEDDPDLLNLYSRALRFRGYEVETTDSAEHAITLLGEGQCVPDIAVLDMSMPGLPGSAVVDFIRQKSALRDLPIIVVSCDEDFRSRLAGARVTFMKKPIGLNELYTAVAKHSA